MQLLPEVRACVNILNLKFESELTLIRLETARHGNLATCHHLHQARNDLVRGARHLALEFIIVLGRQLTLVQLQLQVNRLILVKQANDERVATVALFDGWIDGDDEENLTMV